jgi:hypothetical protein
VRREEGLEGYNTYILLIRVVRLYYVSTRVKEGEEITELQQGNGVFMDMGTRSELLVARQPGREVALHG